MREKKDAIGRVERVLLWFALAIGALIVCYNLLYVRNFSAPGIVIAADSAEPGSTLSGESGAPESLPVGETPGVEATPLPGQSGKLNLNEATASELAALLPGVGDVLAARIIEYRETRGGFTSLSQLLEVQGIGEATYEAILPYVIISS